MNCVLFVTNMAYNISRISSSMNAARMSSFSTVFGVGVGVGGFGGGVVLLFAY